MSEDNSRLPRRKVLQWFAAAGAVTTVGGFPIPGVGQGPATPSGQGYGTDPDLMKVYEPGQAWPLTLSEDQRKTVTALADTILPADDLGPAASEVRVPDYIDEWISAPYPQQVGDRSVIMPGLERFEKFVTEQSGGSFSELDPAGRATVCEKIAGIKEGEDQQLANFLHRFTMVACGAYYSTPEGWKAIGYVGNIAMPTFEGPPQEVLERVGVEQTVTD